jgi:hypothetical protein
LNNEFFNTTDSQLTGCFPEGVPSHAVCDDKEPFPFIAEVAVFVVLADLADIREPEGLVLHKKITRISEELNKGPLEGGGSGLFCSFHLLFKIGKRGEKSASSGPGRGLDHLLCIGTALILSIAFCKADF